MVIVASFAMQVFVADPDPGSVLRGFIPGFEGTESVLLAVGILGATVMPHVIYLHSALTQHRDHRRRATTRSGVSSASSSSTC